MFCAQKENKAIGSGLPAPGRHAEQSRVHGNEAVDGVIRSRRSDSTDAFVNHMTCRSRRVPLLANDTRSKAVRIHESHR